MDLPRNLDLQGLRDVTVASIMAVFLAFVLVSDEADFLVRPLVAAAALAIALSLRPEAFLGFALLLLGLSSVLEAYAIHLGPATLYATDVLVILALVRSSRPEPRFPPSRALRGMVMVAFGAWAALMIVAGIRASNAGESLVTIVRFETALLYFPLLYFALSRILRERRLNVSRLWRFLTFVSVGFVLWMFIMRILNMPFEGSNTVGRLGEVVTSQGSVVRRDFGSATAFIIYPVLALAAVAAMAHASRSKVPTLLAFVGIIATFVTLIRGEIFGMILGIVAILVLRSQSQGSESRQRTSRFRAATAIASGCAAILLTLAYINPQVRDAIVERSLPGVATESQSAQQTAEYRLEALRLGAAVARAHPAGLGFRNEEVLTRSDIDPGYLGHSAPAWLLVFTGWPGLVASVLALLALMGRSFRVRAEPSWLHPAFVGIVLMMVVYCFGAAGLVGQPWVIALAAMVIALRFSIPRATA